MYYNTRKYEDFGNDFRFKFQQNIKNIQFQELFYVLTRINQKRTLTMHIAHWTEAWTNISAGCEYIFTIQYQLHRYFKWVCINNYAPFHLFQ